VTATDTDRQLGALLFLVERLDPVARIDFALAFCDADEPRLARIPRPASVEEACALIAGGDGRQ
jgi:hypothetical protein